MRLEVGSGQKCLHCVCTRALQPTERTIPRPVGACWPKASSPPKRAIMACGGNEEEAPKDLLCSTPERIRTAVTALRGRRPGPLDDGGRTVRARG